MPPAVPSVQIWLVTEERTSKFPARPQGCGDEVPRLRPNATGPFRISRTGAILALNQRLGGTFARDRIERLHHSLVGSTCPEREEPPTRTTYVAAARRYVSAFAGVPAPGVLIDPGRNTYDVREWQAQDV